MEERKIKWTLMQMPASLSIIGKLLAEESPIDLLNYVGVYQNETTLAEEEEIEDILNSIFDEFNTNHPKNFAGRSMTAGDVVKINDDYWLCCSVGWRKKQ